MGAFNARVFQLVTGKIPDAQCHAALPPGKRGAGRVVGRWRGGTA